MKQITSLTQHAMTLSIAALVVSSASVLSIDAAGIDQKALAADLSFENLLGAQPNFNIAGFTVVNGELTAFGSITWTVAGEQVGPLAFQVPVLSVSGSCEVVDVKLGGVETQVGDSLLSFDAANFDIYSGDVTPTAVRSLLCTTEHIAQAGGSALALAQALNRVLPAVQ